MSFLLTIILEAVILVRSWRRKEGLFAPVQCRWKVVGSRRGWTEYRCETCQEVAFSPRNSRPMRCKHPVDSR